MIPQLVTVGHRRRNGRRTRLHIPILPVLLPVLLLLSPLLVVGGLVACAATGVGPLRALRRTARVLSALPGTRIEIAQGRSAVLLSVR